MRRIYPMLLLALMVSCRSHKEVQRDVVADTAAISTSASHRTITSIDSVITKLNFDFDTLDIATGRLSMGDTVETFRLRAVKGRVASNRSQYRCAEDAKTRLDSTAYKVSMADKSAEHTATSAVYTPPDTTAVLVASVLLIGIVVYLLLRRQ